MADGTNTPAGTHTSRVGKQGEPMGDANRQGMGEGGVAMSSIFPPLWMQAENGSRVDVSGIYWFIIAAAVCFIGLPLFVIFMKAGLPP